MKKILFISFYNVRLNRERKIEVKCSNSLHYSVVYLGWLCYKLLFFIVMDSKKEMCADACYKITNDSFSLLQTVNRSIYQCGFRP